MTRMYVNVCALVVLCTAVMSANWMDNRCTQVASVTGTIQNFDRQTAEKVISTIINTNIGLREQLCFQLELVYSDNDKSAGDLANLTNVIYTLKLNNVAQIQNIQNGYQFVIPKAIENKCYCDCPCFADASLGSQNYCSGRAEPCIQIFRTDVSDDGCPGSFICASSHAEGRCSFSIIRDTSFPVFDTMEISPAATWLYLEVNVHDPESGNVIADPIFINYNLGQGNIIDISGRIEGKLSVSNSPMRSIIPTSWYFKEATDTSILYTDVPINSLNEWSLEKLGWFRWRNERTEYPEIKKQDLQSKFSFSYSDCDDDYHSWQFTGRYHNDDYPKITKSSVITKYPEIQSILIANGKVKSDLKQSQRFTIFLDIKEKASVAFYFDEADFDDFNVTLQKDKFSNLFLNISIQKGAGSIDGVFSNGTVWDWDHQFSVYVDSVSGEDVILYHILPSNVICETNRKDYQVCLSTRKKDAICRIASPTCEQLQEFVVPGWKRKEVEGGDSDPGNGGRNKFLDFLSYINPVKWITSLLDSISNIKAWIGMIINIVILIAVIVGLVCLCRCLNCSRFCKKDEKPAFTAIPLSEKPGV